ncbi:MAG: RlmE family RNA methyltransferase [Acidiferrobacteraceae bacterium]
MARTRSSRMWLREHFEDPYVQRAWKEGYRSRAVYKLKEIDRHDRLLSPGMTVVDLGAAPGGWAQYVHEKIGPGGCVIAVDLLPMVPLPGVEYIEGDFTEDEVLGRLKERLGHRRPDLVISDMAPNISGIGSSDQARAVYLAELALDFAVGHLLADGACLIKTFQGEGFPGLLRDLKARFKTTAVRKPEASRARSAESYLLGRGLKV